MAHVTKNRILWSGCGHNLLNDTIDCPLCLQRQLKRAQAALKAGLTLHCGSSDDAHNTYLTGREKGQHTEDCPGCMMEAVLEEMGR